MRLRQRARRRLQQPREAVGEHGRALLAGHGNVAAALEEQVAERRVQLLRAALQILRLQRGEVQAHAAVDVVADGLRHQEAARGHHRAHGDAAGLVEVWGDGHLRDRRLGLEASGEASAKRSTVRLRSSIWTSSVTADGSTGTDSLAKSTASMPYGLSMRTRFSSRRDRRGSSVMRVPWRKKNRPSRRQPLSGHRREDRLRSAPRTNNVAPSSQPRNGYGVSSATHDHAAPPALLRDSTPSGEFLDT
jgi:hypothetical protein